MLYSEVYFGLFYTMACTDYWSVTKFKKNDVITYFHRPITNDCDQDDQTFSTKDNIFPESSHPFLQILQGSAQYHKNTR